jgi:hypothetical protein
METMPRTTHPRRSFIGDEGGRSGSSLGGETLVRMARVFYEDKRRSYGLHLGPVRTVGVLRDVGTPAPRAMTGNGSRSTAREVASAAAMFAEAGRAGIGARVLCSWVGDTAAFSLRHSPRR